MNHDFFLSSRVSESCLGQLSVEVPLIKLFNTIKVMVVISADETGPLC